MDILCYNKTLNELLLERSVLFWKEQQDRNQKVFITSIAISVVPILGIVGLISIIFLVFSRVFTIRKVYKRRVKAIHLKIFENFLVLIREFNENDSEPLMRRQENLIKSEIKRRKSKSEKYSFKKPHLKTKQNVAKKESTLKKPDKNVEAFELNVITINCEHFSQNIFQNNDKPCTSFASD